MSSTHRPTSASPASVSGMSPRPRCKKACSAASTSTPPGDSQPRADPWANRFASFGSSPALTWVALRPRPLILHTYHGHVLEGYYSRPVTALYRLLERFCATFTDALIGVSQSTIDDLVRLRVAPRERFRVVPLGLELEPFLALDD